MAQRFGLISNPASERNKRGMAEIQERAATQDDLVHRELSQALPLSVIMAEMAEADVDVLICNSGDGMIQGVMTSLLQQRRHGRMPALALLPRGMANMTAADCGLKGRDWHTLERLLIAGRQGRLDDYKIRRHVLRVDYRDDKPPQRGMFMGALGIYDAIKICTGSVHAHGVKGEWSHAVTLAGLLLGSMFRGLEALGIDGHDVRLRVDQEEILNERLLLLLCTTLDRLVLRSRPFWRCDGGPVRFTRISYPPRGLVRNAWRVLYGGEPRRLPETHYRSCGAQQVELWLDEPFTIDGEFLDPLRTRPVRISAFETIDFIRL